MNKVLLAVCVVAAVVTGYVLLGSNSANAPVTKNETTKVAQSEAKTTTESSQQRATTKPTTNSTNEKKPMGLEIKTTQEGTGERVIKSGDHIFVHYTGKLTNGTVFDSSVTRGVPFDFVIGQGMVIAGWEQGFIGAKVGEKRTLTIPAEMGYGSRDMGSIPANSTLIFDVEVVSIK